ncbi:hypothetical protein CEP54_007816 [Fusarium duplospermum]|uniref:Uncharacterized protein n=1 Tax=Fusarium duplospermum TaxID=1325734 RepID=A0A428PZD1_9HYPO|nr:hypothetical protein CEP54_007816 [Fusarium duplospermum]
MSGDDESINVQTDRSYRNKRERLGTLIAGPRFLMPRGGMVGATGRSTLLRHQSSDFHVKARERGTSVVAAASSGFAGQKSARVRDDQSATIAGEASRGISKGPSGFPKLSRQIQ